MKSQALWRWAAVAAFGWVLVGTALSVSAQQLPAARINIPQLAQAPKLDGEINGAEWASASGAPVAITRNDSRLTQPHGQFWIGRVGNDLYFAFETRDLPQVPNPPARQRDGDVWQDDAVEFVLNNGSTTVQLVVNAAGTVLDLKDGQAAWNGPWEIAAKKIGQDFAFGEGADKGFAVEVRLPLVTAGLGQPNQGQVWKMQVALDCVGKNLAAVWSPSSGASWLDQWGQAVFGGKPHQLQMPAVSPDGQKIRTQGLLGEKAHIQIDMAGREPRTTALAAGKLSAEATVGGTGGYAWQLGNDWLGYGFVGEARLNVPLVAVPVPSRQSFYLHLDPQKMSDVMPLEVSLQRGGTVLWREVLDPNQPEQLTRWVSYAGWAVGPVSLQVLSKPVGQQPVDLGQMTLAVPARSDWEDFKLPAGLPLVPEPFTQVVADQQQASVWGRSYAFGSSPFLDQVNSNDGPVLARAVELRGRVGGKPLQWKLDQWKLAAAFPDRAEYVGIASDHGLRIDVKTTLYFDGVLRLDWKLGPTGEPQPVEDLHLVIPVRRDVARYFQHSWLEGGTHAKPELWPDGGRVPENGLAKRFTHFFWLGNDQRGIQWFCEGQRIGWTPADPTRVVELRNTGDAKELLLHLADGTRTFDKPIDFSFGLIATPIKPRPHPSDIPGSRIISLSGPGHLAPGARMRISPTVLITASPASMGPQGCMEAELRADWETSSLDNQTQVIPLLTHRDTFGTAIQVNWSAADRAITLEYQSPGAAKRMIGKASADLLTGSWHRLALNYGPKFEVYLDGRSIICTPAPGALPVFNSDSAHQVGGRGRIALRGWRLSNIARPAAQLSPDNPLTADGNTVHLTNIASDPTLLAVCDSEIGYLANPAYLRGAWKYDEAQQCIVAGDESPLMSGADFYAWIGVKAAVLMDWTEYTTGQGPWQAGFRPALSEANRVGIKLLPYSPVFGFENVGPDFEAHRYEFSVTAPDEEPIMSWPGPRGIKFFDGAFGGPFGQRILYQIDQMMRAGAGGVYIDSYVMPNASWNPILGHLEMDPVTGKRARRIRIYDHRQWLWDVYRLIKHHRPDAIIDAHLSRNFPLPVMGPVDTITNFENIGALPNWRTAVSLEQVWAQAHTRPFGFLGNALFYANRPVPPELGITMMGLQGQTPRLMWGMSRERAAALWALADVFDFDGALWVGYDSQRKIVTASPDEVIASAFVHPGERAMVMVANWSDQPVPAEISVDNSALGLSSDAPVTILNANRSTRLTDGKLSLRLMPRRITYLWIGQGAEEFAARRQATVQWRSGDL